MKPKKPAKASEGQNRQDIELLDRLIELENDPELRSDMLSWRRYYVEHRDASLGVKRRGWLLDRMTRYTKPAPMPGIAKKQENGAGANGGFVLPKVRLIPLDPPTRAIIRWKEVQI